MRKFLCASVLAVLILLCSCAENVRTIDYDELSLAVSSSCGKKLVRSDVDDGCGYMLGISDDDFEKYVDSAEIYREETGTTGYELTLITVSDGYDSERLRAMMASSYEWAPCDPSEIAVFSSSGGYVMRVKGTEEDARRAYEVFRSACGGNRIGMSERRAGI